MNSAEQLRASLHTMLTQAEIDFEMWQAMRVAAADPENTVMLNRKYGRFYGAQNALFNSLIIILYKVFEKRSDTANFWQLRKTFPNTIDPNAERKLDRLFDKIKHTWIKVGIVRNNVVGHQSIEISATEVHQRAGMTTAEILEMIEDCQNLLYLIAHHFQDTHVIFNLKGTMTFDNLIRDLRAVNGISS